MVVVAYGLWKERPWSRAAMMGFWAAGIIATAAIYYVTGISRDDAIAALVSYALVMAIAWWYLYSKKSVVEYFRAIAAKSQGS